MKRLGLVGGLAMLVVAAATCSDSPVVMPDPPSAGAPTLDTSVMASLRQYEEGGCAVTAPDADGKVRGMAIPRKRLPFVVPAVKRDSLSDRTNGAPVQLRYKLPNGTPVTLDCWVPRTVTLEDIAASLKKSRDGRWRVIAEQLPRQRIVPAEEKRLPPSAEALAIVGADTARSDKVLANGTCVIVEVYISWENETGWHSLSFQIEVCYGDGGGSVWPWMVGNGYDQFPYAYIDADKYVIYQTDSVLFTADYYTGGVENILLNGFQWTSTAGAPDPWTDESHCLPDGGDCKVQVHGTGRMRFSFYLDYTLVEAGVNIEALVPDDVGDGPGDADPPIPDPWGDEDEFAFAESGGKRLSGPYAPETNFPLAPLPGPITPTQSTLILAYAMGMGEWTYTQGCFQGCNATYTEPNVNLAAKIGDCTDFVWKSVKDILGGSWPYTKISTSMFNTGSPGNLAAYGYIEVDSASARAGDIVVRAKTSGCMCGHAGIFRKWGAGGNPIGWANNGIPAKASANQANRDNPTGVYNFKVKSGYVTRFFRPST